MYVFHSRVSRRHGRAVVLLFFALIRDFAFFFQGQNNFISLKDIHVQHLASLCPICGDKIKDHKRKVDTINSFVSEIHQIWKKIYYCWILQMFIHS